MARKVTKFVESVRERIEGKAVEAVEASDFPMAICRFTMSDGRRFRIHATEAGAWVEDDISKNGLYQSVGSLCVAVGLHRERSCPGLGQPTPPARATASGGTITVDAFDGTLFKIRQDVQDEWDRRVLSHPDVLKFVAKVAESGDLWTMWFSSDRERPEGYDPWVDGDLSTIPEELLRSFS